MTKFGGTAQSLVPPYGLLFRSPLMSRTFLVSFIAVGLLAATPAFGADETYTLKLYQSKKGDKSEHTKNEDSKSVITFTAGGNEKKENETGAKKEAYTEEILEKKAGDRLATKL